MRRDQLPPHKTSTYVMERYKAVYVSVNKAACTSLKWLVAELQGEDPEQFYRSVSREVTRAMCIHRRAMWKKTRMLKQLSDRELAAVSPENGWFVFAVVRHPSARLFSAWESKFLLREPRWQDMYGDAPWFPRIPGSTAEVIDDWQRFMAALAAEPDQPFMRDRHFMPQHQMLVPERMPYTRIYTTREIPQLLEDFERHLRAHGWAGDRLSLRKSNETPLLPLPAMFTPEVRSTLEQLYEGDFATFGYEDVQPDALHGADEYQPAQLAEVVRLIERSERIGDLAMRAQALQAANRTARAKRAPARGAGSPLRTAAARMRRKLTARLHA
jgi:hypothetical protein